MSTAAEALRLRPTCQNRNEVATQDADAVHRARSRDEHCRAFADEQAERPTAESAGARHGDLPLSLAGPHNPWLVAIVVSMATFMEVLDTSIANVSLRHIAGSLAASVDESTWVLTSYLVANAIVLPICGWLATVIGRKRFYMGCVALFTVSSVLCGFAPSLTWLIVFRVLQGIGGGGLAPSEQSILADSFPPEQARAWPLPCTAWRWSWRRPSARRSAAGSPTTTVGTGSSSSICRSGSCRWR